MELRNLKTFLQIVDSGSFSKASEQLGYTQSTVSFQIRQLEDELGCRLFDRIGKKVALTDKGEKLLSHALAITNSVNLLTEDFSQSEEPEGIVRMFSSDSICERMMLLHYQDFCRRYPGIRLVFSTGATVDLLKVLDRNEVDVIFTLDSHIYQQDYVIVSESPVELHFVADAHHPLAGRTGLHAAELMDCSFILTEKGASYRQLLDDRLARMSLQIRPVLETGRTDIIVKSLVGGQSIGFLPDFVTEDEVNAGRLVRLDVDDIDLTIWKQLICRRDKWISKPLAVFLDYVKEHEFTW